MFSQAILLKSVGGKILGVPGNTKKGFFLGISIIASELSVFLDEGIFQLCFSTLYLFSLVATILYAVYYL